MKRFLQWMKQIHFLSLLFLVIWYERALRPITSLFEFEHFRDNYILQCCNYYFSCYPSAWPPPSCKSKDIHFPYQRHAWASKVLNIFENPMMVPYDYGGGGHLIFFLLSPNLKGIKGSNGARVSFYLLSSAPLQLDR